MVKALLFLAFGLILAIGNVMGADLGVRGATFPIQEPDMLTQLEMRLKSLEASGELEKLQKNLVGTVSATIQKPKAVGGLQKTKAFRSFTWDPTIVLPFDLKDAKGTVFYQAGRRLNPLHHRAYEKILFFLDGRDVEQIDWVKEQPLSKGIVILVAGSPTDVSQALGVRCFFDQKGLLTQKFGIQQVPARVQSEGEVLRIEECVSGVGEDS
ncbi:MAG: type-F conjugative transfer system protein TraW [Alphaproteobacteria bacterium]